MCVYLSAQSSIVWWYLVVLYLCTYVYSSYALLVPLMYVNVFCLLTLAPMCPITCSTPTYCPMQLGAAVERNVGRCLMENNETYNGTDSLLVVS